MPSPFPGMDPYFEQPGEWRDFHTAFLVGLRAALTPQLTGSYYAKIEEALHLEGDDPPRPFAVADIGLSGGPLRSKARGLGAAAPVVGVVPMTAERPWRSLTVRRTDGGKIVTVVELLSPSNKEAGKGRDKYLDKRQRILESRAHFVELDLLRGGQRMPVRPTPTVEYCLLVSRRQRRPNVDLWPLALRDPLPLVPVPVRRGDPEPVIDLRAVLDRVYDEAGYGRRIYRADPDPPLSPADAEWAAGLLRPATG